MNERIRELAAIARGQAIVGTTVDEEQWKQHEQFVEKFAELIVQECIEICNQHPSKIFKKEWDADVVAWDITQRIKGRFGVEDVGS